MNTINFIILIIIVHFLADFALQTHEQAQGKGKGNSFFNEMLFYHAGSYALIWMIVYLILPTPEIISNIPIGIRMLVFGVVIFVPHYITDWITSRIGKKFWDKQDFHNGFVVVGFDQVVHYLCLIWAFYFCKLI